MSALKNTAIASRKKYRWSTRVDIVDADSGNNGGPDISGFGLRAPGYGLQASGFGKRFLATDHDDDEGRKQQDRRGAGHADRAHDRQAVPPGFRVVVIAIEQQRIHRRADFAIGCIDDREAQIARSVLDAKEVPGEPPVRSEHDHAGWMRELVRVLVPDIPKAGRFGEAIDGWLVACEKVPRRGAARVLVAADVGGFLGRRALRRV